MTAEAAVLAMAFASAVPAGTAPLALADSAPAGYLMATDRFGDVMTVGDTPTGFDRPRPEEGPGAAHLCCGHFAPPALVQEPLPAL